MDKKRGYNIKYLLLFTSAAALLCALAAYISINDTYISIPVKEQLFWRKAMALRRATN